MTCAAEQPPVLSFRRRTAEESRSPQLHLPSKPRRVRRRSPTTYGTPLLATIPALALLGIADSAAAFGLGMTRTIEQGDLESFSPNCKDRRLEIKLREPKTAFANPPNAPAAEGPASYSPARALGVPFRSMKLPCREQNGRIEWRFRCRSSCQARAR